RVQLRAHPIGAVRGRGVEVAMPSDDAMTDAPDTESEANWNDPDATQEPTEPELRAFFGPNADYYLRQWHGTAGRRSSWPAFFLGPLWLHYRRLYVPGLLVYTVWLVETAVQDAVFSWFPGHPRIEQLVDRGFSVVAAIACSAWGNKWYLSRTRRIIAETRR